MTKSNSLIEVTLQEALDIKNKVQEFLVKQRYKFRNEFQFIANKERTVDIKLLTKEIAIYSKLFNELKLAIAEANLSSIKGENTLLQEYIFSLSELKQDIITHEKILKRWKESSGDITWDSFLTKKEVEDILANLYKKHYMTENEIARLNSVIKLNISKHFKKFL